MKKTLNLNLKLKYSLALSAILLVLCGLVAHAQTSPVQMSGFGWSDTTGYISFSDPNADVFLDPVTGNITGYAWSSSVGWVKFGGLSSFPSAPGTVAGNAQVNMSTGALTGWIRACAGTVNNPPNQNLPGDCSSMTSRTDGWDGWISLSGGNTSDNNYASTYSTTTGDFSGYPWSSQNIGWFQWNSNGYVVTTNPTNTPISVEIAADGNYGNDTLASGHTTASLTWQLVSGDPTSCSITSGNNTGQHDSLFNNVHVAPTNLTGSTTSTVTGSTNNGAGMSYTLTCSNATQAGTDSVNVSTSTTGGGNNPPPVNTTVKMWLDNDPTEALTHVPIHPSDSATLNWDMTAFTNQYVNQGYVPSCTGSSNGPASVPSWTNPSNALGYKALDTGDPSNANAVSLSGLAVGTYSLSLTCQVRVPNGHGFNSFSSSTSDRPVSITVTNSTLQEK